MKSKYLSNRCIMEDICLLVTNLKWYWQDLTMKRKKLFNLLFSEILGLLLSNMKWRYLRILNLKRKKLILIKSLKIKNKSSNRLSLKIIFLLQQHLLKEYSKLLWICWRSKNRLVVLVWNSNSKLQERSWKRTRKKSRSFMRDWLH